MRSNIAFAALPLLVAALPKPKPAIVDPPALAASVTVSNSVGLTIPSLLSAADITQAGAGAGAIVRRGLFPDSYETESDGYGGPEYSGSSPRSGLGVGSINLGGTDLLSAGNIQVPQVDDLVLSLTGPAVPSATALLDTYEAPDVPQVYEPSLTGIDISVGTVLETLSVSVVPSVSISESISLSVSASVSALPSVSISESFSESISLSISASVSAFPSVSISESISVSEFPSASVTFVPSVSETLNINLPEISVDLTGEGNGLFKEVEETLGNLLDGSGDNEVPSTYEPTTYDVSPPAIDIPSPSKSILLLLPSESALPIIDSEPSANLDLPNLSNLGDLDLPSLDTSSLDGNMKSALDIGSLPIPTETESPVVYGVDGQNLTPPTYGDALGDDATPVFAASHELGRGVGHLVEGATSLNTEEVGTGAGFSADGAVDLAGAAVRSLFAGTSAQPAAVEVSPPTEVSPPVVVSPSVVVSPPVVVSPQVVSVPATYARL